MSDLAKSMNEKVVRRLAGDSYYSQGEEYFQQRRVLAVAPTPNGLIATVRGTRDYDVRLEDDDGIVDYSCDCSIGDEGFFCKHCVAAALAWLDARERNGPHGEELSVEAAVDRFLDQDRDRIAEALVEWAQADPGMHARLLLFLANKNSPDAGFEVVRRTFRLALDPNQYPDEDTWMSAVSTGIDMLEETIPPELSSELVLLCEDALEQVVATMTELGGLTEDADDLLRRIEELHYQACLEAKPDPEALAGRLFDWEMRSVYDVFFDAPQRYAPVLGEKGLLRFRELVEDGWSKASKDPKDGDSETLLMLFDSLAEVSGNLDERIEAMARDLGGPHRYLQIVQLCADEGRMDLAIDWAEKCRRAFPNQSGERLTLLLATAYEACGQPEQAVQAAFAEFERAPSTRSYALVKICSQQASKPELWLRKALDVLQRDAERKAAKSSPIPAGALLVEALLDAGDAEGAWTAACRFGCAEFSWIDLANRFKEDHPARAGETYLRAARNSIQRGARTSSYEEGVLLLEEAAAAMRRAGKNREFQTALLQIQKEHRAKRKLMGLIRERSKQLSP